VRTDIESPSLTTVRTLVEPIAADLGLDVYDIEHRGGTLRVTLDTPAGSDEGITLDTLALASRLVSKELDQHDPIPSRYTLEVTSPGVERHLRTPDHFRRETGKEVAIRLSDVGADERRVQGAIEAADDRGVSLRLADGTARTVAYDQIDRARTVFEWGPQPKPGRPTGRRGRAGTVDETAQAGASDAADRAANEATHRDMEPS
jgi:ribosome maturation factor RimP